MTSRARNRSEILARLIAKNFQSIINDYFKCPFNLQIHFCHTPGSLPIYRVDGSDNLSYLILSRGWFLNVHFKLLFWHSFDNATSINNAVPLSTARTVTLVPK